MLRNNILAVGGKTKYIMIFLRNHKPNFGNTNFMITIFITLAGVCLLGVLCIAKHVLNLMRKATCNQCDAQTIFLRERAFRIHGGDVVCFVMNWLRGEMK